jgi:hypothetical protein
VTTVTRVMDPRRDAVVDRSGRDHPFGPSPLADSSA